MAGSQMSLDFGIMESSADCKLSSPAAEWAEESAKHALDDLFGAISAYRSTEGYKQLMEFVKNSVSIHPSTPYCSTFSDLGLNSWLPHTDGRIPMAEKSSQVQTLLSFSSLWGQSCLFTMQPILSPDPTPNRCLLELKNHLSRTVGRSGRN